MEKAKIEFVRELAAKGKKKLEQTYHSDKELVSDTQECMFIIGYRECEKQMGITESEDAD